MRTCDSKNNGPVIYIKVVYTDKETNDRRDGWMFCGNKEFLRKFLEGHKDVIEAKSPMRNGQLSSRGKEELKDIDLENTVVLCENIKEYIL